MTLPSAKPRLAAILTILLASCTGLGTATAAAESGLLDEANLALLPPDTNSLLGVDVERLKGTTLYRYFEALSREPANENSSEIDAWAALTGFDPRRDVTEILIISWQRPDEELRAGQALPFLAVARGHFDASRLGEQFVARGAQEEEYRGSRVFLFPRDSPDPPVADPGETIVIPPPVPEALPQIAIAFVEDGLAIGGGYDAITAAIDRRAQGTPPLASHESLVKRGGELRDGHQFWAVSSQPANLLREGIEGVQGDTRMIRILKSMSESTIAFDLASGLRGSVAALCGADDDAKLLADLARGFLATARFSGATDSALMPMLDRVAVAENGASIEVVVDIDNQQLETYLESLKLEQAAIQ